MGQDRGFFAVAGIYFANLCAQLLDNQIIEGNVYQAGRRKSSGEAVVGVYARQPDSKRIVMAFLGRSSCVETGSSEIRISS